MPWGFARGQEPSYRARPLAVTGKSSSALDLPFTPEWKGKGLTREL